MPLPQCSQCQRHHAPGISCPYCQNVGMVSSVIPPAIGKALLLAAAASLGCVAAPGPPRPQAPALIDSIPTPGPEPTPTPSPTPATTYGLPPPPKRRRVPRPV